MNDGLNLLNTTGMTRTFHSQTRIITRISATSSKYLQDDSRQPLRRGRLSDRGWTEANTWHDNALSATVSESFSHKDIFLAS